MSSNPVISFFSALVGRRGMREGMKLYHHLMAAARRADFFAVLQVPDTPEGRFELLTLHAWLLLRALRDAGETEQGRTMLEALFAQLDADLREAGTGDMGVPRRMKNLAQTFYSRLAALDAASGDHAAMETLLRKTLYAAHTPDDDALARMTTWLMTAGKNLTGDGQFEFPDP